MSYLIAAFGLRLLLAAMIYLAATAYWVSNARGWAGIGLFAMSIVFGFFAAAALLIAMVIGRKIVSRDRRMLAHPPLTVALFALLSYVIAGVLMDMQTDLARDMLPFTGLVAVIAVIDALAGYGLDGWVARRQAGQAA